MFNIEDLDKALKYKTIKEVKAYATEIYMRGDELFKRMRTFKIGKNTYRIEWYCNCSYLYCPGNVTVPFQRVKLLNTWPHRSKMNLQFYDSRDKVCCILKIE